MEKLLTFAVPSYNMEQYLRKCISSCVCDNMEYLEVIIVNDGSKDRTSEIGHKLVNEFPNVVRIIDKENGHYGTCVNYALSEAKGKYFKMLDPDDWCDTEALNTLLEHLKTCDTDLVVTIAHDLYADGTFRDCLDFPISIEEGKVFDAKTFNCVKEGFLDLFCSHLLTYKTELLRLIGLKLQGGIAYTDNEFVFYPLDKIKDIIFYRLPLYQYLTERPGQSTEVMNVNTQKQMWQVLEPMLNYYKKHKSENTEAVLRNQCLMIAEIGHWIYYPIFNDGATEENRKYLYQFEEILKNDKELSDTFELKLRGWKKCCLKHYRETGKLMEYSWFSDTWFALRYNHRKFRLWMRAKKKGLYKMLGKSK